MSSLEVRYVPPSRGGSPSWSVREETGLRAEASSPILDRGTIKATVTVYRMREGDPPAEGGAVVYRDTLNLTSGRARRKYIAHLSENYGLDSLICETSLIALEEAIRRYKEAEGPSVKAGAAGAEEKAAQARAEEAPPITLARFEELAREWLVIPDPDVFAVVFGALAAHRLGGETPWLLLVAPPSSAKTEIIRSLSGIEGIFELSSLTGKTLASGLDEPGMDKDPSLLSRLSSEILTIKDMTTILELHPDERSQILSILREVYDGRYDHYWGSGRELHWRGRLGLLAGVTPAIDDAMSVMSLMGPRFLLFRPSLPDREEMALRAMSNASRDTQMRESLSRAAAGVVKGLVDLPEPVVSEEGLRWLARVARLVTNARSAVMRDWRSKEIEAAPSLELPARFARQLHALLRGIAQVRMHTWAEEEDYRAIARLAMHCVPYTRARILEILAHAETALLTSEVGERSNLPTAAARRHLEDLLALGLAWRQSQGTGHADRWTLVEDAAALVAALESPPRLEEAERWERL